MIIGTVKYVRMQENQVPVKCEVLRARKADERSTFLVRAPGWPHSRNECRVLGGTQGGLMVPF